MDILGYSLGFAGTLVALALVAYALGARLVREAEEHDSIDFGCPFEDELTAYVTDLNNTHRKDAA